MIDLSQIELLARLSVPRYSTRIEALAIPTAAWNEEPLLCLQLNDQWVAHVIGLLVALDQPDAWIGTAAEQYAARQQVNEIMLAFMEVCNDMAGCNCDLPLVRINSDGVYQESDDNGVTWHDAPTHDPRNSIPRIPPYPAPSTDNAKCAYADSVVNHFKEGFVDVLEEGQTVEEILGFLTGIAAEVFGPLTGPIGWIIPALLAIATAIVAVSVTAVSDAFTTDVWNELRCLIFSNMNADGSFTNAQVSTIYTGIPGGAVCEVVLRSWISAIGATGMTNAAHLAKGSTSTDCSGCITFCGTDWVIVDDRQDLPIYNGTAKTISGDATQVVTNYYWAIKVDYPACCNVETVITGAVDAKFYAPCDYTGELTFVESIGWVLQGLNLNGDYRGILIRSSTPFSVVVTFST